MKPPTRRLTLSLLLLLAPTVAVGALGLSLFYGLEEDLEEVMSRGTATFLRSAEREFGSELDRVVRRIADDLDGLSALEVTRKVREIPRALNDEPQPVVAAFLLRERGNAWWPRLSRSTQPEPPLAPREDSDVPEHRRLIAAIKAAESESTADQFESALLALEAFHKQEAPLPTSDARARLAYEKGRLLRRLGRLEDAQAEFRAAQLELDSERRGRSMPPHLHGLQLMTLLNMVEIADDLAAIAGTNGGIKDGGGQRLEPLLALLRGIGDGDFDGIGDHALGGLYDRIESRALAIASPDLEFGIDELRDRNRERVALRTLVSEVRRFSFDFKVDERADRTITRALYGQGGTTLLAFRAVHLGTQRIPAWLGMQLDLAVLFAELTAQLERQLSTTGQPFRVELVDADGERVAGTLDTLPEDDAERALERATRHALSPPLTGFTLLCLPRDPVALERDTRRDLLVQGGFLLALALFAGAGAFALVRTLRRESELASLKTGFVGRVSHELKTPLALIRMYGETLALGRAKDPEKITKFSAIIAKEADRLQAMIENVLDFSQIEAGTKVYDPQPVRLDEHVAHLLESYRPHLEEQGFSLGLTGADLPAVTAEVDPEGLTQAIVNLLTNAQKYTGDGEKTIEVRIGNDARNAWIEVLDRGIGVPEAERERVFEMFYRASTAGEQRGAGLGLALVRHFATAHGGTALHEPRDGGGSVFRIVLPIAAEVG